MISKKIVSCIDKVFSRNRCINEKYLSLKEQLGKIKKAGVDEARRHYVKTYDIDKLNDKVKFLKKDIDFDFDWSYKRFLVSIVISTYNRLSILKQTIASIKKFTKYPNYELIIVDDCSTERGMKEYLMSLEGEFEGRCVVLFNTRNMGYAKSNNKGIKIAKGKYVCLFNADLIATENWLEELVKLILLKDEIKIVSSKLLYPWDGRVQHAGVTFTKCYWDGSEGKYLLPYNIYQGEPMTHLNTMYVKEYPAMGFSCALIEKKALEEVGLLPVGYEFGGYDDIETCMLMRKKGYRFYFCPTSILYHYETLGMVQHRHYRKNERRKALYFMKRWHTELENIFKEKKEFVYNNLVLNKKEFREGKTVLRSYPQTLHIESSSLCNIRCIMCSQKWVPGEERGNLSDEVFEKMAYLKYIRNISLSGNGEPFFNNKIMEYIERIRQYSKAEMVITTNGSLLDKYLYDRRFYEIDAMAISIDGATPETYNSIREGSDFNKVIENIKLIERQKIKLGVSKPKLYFGFVAMRRNIEELPKLVELAKQLGIWSVTVVYLTVHHKSLKEESLFYHQTLCNKVFSISKKKSLELDIPLDLPPAFGRVQEKSQGACLDPWRFMYVRWNGNVMACCGGLFPVADLNKQNFSEAWNGIEMQTLRKSILTNKLQKACQTCHDEKGSFNPNKEESHIQLL